MLTVQGAIGTPLIALRRYVQDLEARIVVLVAQDQDKQGNQTSSEIHDIPDPRFLVNLRNHHF